MNSSLTKVECSFLQNITAFLGVLKRVFLHNIIAFLGIYSFLQNIIAFLGVYKKLLGPED